MDAYANMDALHTKEIYVPCFADVRVETCRKLTEVYVSKIVGEEVVQSCLNSALLLPKLTFQLVTSGCPQEALCGVARQEI